jgi:two-component system cell cycle sensor histidine kinase/response regulator CckA
VTAPHPSTAGADFAALLHECPDPAFLLEAGTGGIVPNERLVELTGYSTDELPGALARRILDPGDRATVGEQLRLAFQGKSRRTRIRATTKEGHPLLLEFTAIPLPDAGGRVAAALGVGVAVNSASVPVTPERAELRVDGFLRSTIDQIDLGVYYLDPDFRITFVNPTGARYLRATVTSVLGQSFPRRFPEAWAGPFGEAYRRSMRERSVTRTRAYYPPFQQWFEATARPTDNGIAVDLRDVTEDQERRARLDETTARLGAQAALLDAARDAMTVRELDSRVRYWNRGAEELFGWTADEVAGRSARELLFPDPRAYDSRTAEVLRSGHWTGELTQRRRDGSLIVVDCRWQLLRDQEGRPSAIFAVESDITEYRKSEEERYRAQRMESLGTLAGGIAHDLNNVLTPVLMAAQLLLAEEPDERKRELLASVEAAAQRGAGLIRRVLSFAKGDEGQRRVVSVDALVGELAAFCREAMPKAVEVSVEVPEALPAVLGDPTQLMQVLVNLVTNARDAMPAGGRLGIEAAVSRSSGGAAGEVVLSICDTGSGMDEAVSSRIFEPFFSTKDPGLGTGLGLPTSAAIVRAHGGRIEVESAIGVGSCFRVHLPATHEVPDSGEPELAAPDAPEGRGELILVADDEAAIRDSVRRVLSAHGYRTVEAPNGSEALEAARDPEVALVLLDLMMPVLGGADVIDRLLTFRPGTPILAISGFDGDGRGEAAARAGSARFLAKPFSTSALLAAVADALHAVPVP